MFGRTKPQTDVTPDYVIPLIATPANARSFGNLVGNLAKSGMMTNDQVRIVTGRVGANLLHNEKMGRITREMGQTLYNAYCYGFAEVR